METYKYACLVYCELQNGHDFFSRCSQTAPGRFKKRSWMVIFRHHFDSGMMKANDRGMEVEVRMDSGWVALVLW